jgi:hypothetical protein
MVERERWVEREMGEREMGEREMGERGAEGENKGATTGVPAWRRTSSYRAALAFIRWR